MSKPTTIKLTEKEKQYARDKSRDIGGCRNDSSIAYTLKWLLHREAFFDASPIGPIYHGGKEEYFGCNGCYFLDRRSCVLTTGNHCIRRADDFYTNKNQEDRNA